MAMSILNSASRVTISGGNIVAAGPGSSVTINQGGQLGVSSVFKDLSAAAAHTALHDSAARFDAPRCHRNTRAKYRHQLELWMLGEGEEFDGKQLIWLHGGAGAGKSAIMQSVVEQCAQHGSVLGSFFFSRADPSRNTAEVLIPTLAYQVAQAFPEAMAVLDPILQRNPLIFKASLHTQALELLVRPLLHLIENGILDTTSPLLRVFFIDGLDECEYTQKQALIIHVIASMLGDHHLPICFLIASRPEIAISSAFEREKKLHGRLTTISLGNDADAESDILQFIEDSFLDILGSHPWRMHIELPWPDPAVIRHLVEKSSGHFIYAATVMRYISSSDEHPGRALKVVQGLEPSRIRSPFAELDALYMHILTSAKYRKQVLEILRYRYMSRSSASVASLCYVLHIAPQDVSLFLADVQSLVSLAPNDIGEVYLAPKHASLGDFLRKKARSQGLYIATEDYYASFLARYFQLLDAGPIKLPPSFDSLKRFEFVLDLLDCVAYALGYSEDRDLLQSLVASHSPYDIWNFCVESLAPDTMLSGYTVRRSATNFVNSYICALRDSVALHSDVLYVHQLRMYIELVLGNINDLVHKKPQYRIIPALIFSSHRSGLLLTCNLMRFDERFHIPEFEPADIFFPLRRHNKSKKIDPRACEAIRQMPESHISWSSDLAIAMTLLLQQLVHLSGPGPSVMHSSPHRQWLRRHKALKHISLGLPRISSALSHYIGEIRPGINGADLSDNRKCRSFLYSRWRRLLPSPRNKIQTQRDKCRALLKAVIFYLHKADCTNEVVVLARRSLPVTALWFPKLMKRARAEIDAYLCRWEESAEGLLEMTKSLHINDID